MPFSCNVLWWLNSTSQKFIQFCDLTLTLVNQGCSVGIRLWQGANQLGVEHTRMGLVLHLLIRHCLDQRIPGVGVELDVDLGGHVIGEIQ